MERIHYLLDKQKIFHNFMISNKSSMLLRNKSRQNSFKSRDQNFTIILNTVLERLIGRKSLGHCRLAFLDIKVIYVLVQEFDRCAD